MAIAVLLTVSACKKSDSTTGASLTGTWVKAGPSGSGINFQIIINDANKTTQIGYNAGTTANFTSTGSGSYSRTDSQISLTSTVTCPSIVGVYAYTVNNTTLSLTLSSDACVDNTGSPRSGVISGNWTRQ